MPRNPNDIAHVPEFGFWIGRNRHGLICGWKLERYTLYVNETDMENLLDQKAIVFSV
jgi:hypothetical protein